MEYLPLSKLIRISLVILIQCYNFVENQTGIYQHIVTPFQVADEQQLS